MNDEHLNLTVALTDTPEAAAHTYRVVARGEIDTNTASRLTDALDALVDDGALLVVLDASGVVFLDSSGLRVIVNSGHKLTAAGGRLLIEGMSGAVQRVFEVSGLIEKYRA